MTGHEHVYVWVISPSSFKFFLISNGWSTRTLFHEFFHCCFVFTRLSFVIFLFPLQSSIKLVLHLDTSSCVSCLFLWTFVELSTSDRLFWSVSFSFGISLFRDRASIHLVVICDVDGLICVLISIISSYFWFRFDIWITYVTSTFPFIYKVSFLMVF